jgi:hypothetical protein
MNSTSSTSNHLDKVSKWFKRVVPGLCALALVAGCAAPEKEFGWHVKPNKRTRAIVGCFGTYNGEPRDQAGRVDVARLLDDLVDLRANTYNWLIWHGTNDWTDLQRFLPLARKQGIRVWVTLVPPSESPPRTKNYSEPFRLDYERWATEIGKLSAQEPNLVAWSIDDFAHNLKFYTPERLKKIRELTHRENPRLAFIPCCYFRQLTPQFAQNYQGLLDGILFPYKRDSIKENLTDAGQVETEVLKVRALFGPEVPVILDVYASKHSRLENPKTEYIQQVMRAGRKSADGVLIYCHQPRSTPKYEALKSVFQEWAGRP